DAVLPRTGRGGDEAERVSRSGPMFRLNRDPSPRHDSRPDARCYDPAPPSWRPARSPRSGPSGRVHPLLTCIASVALPQEGPVPAVAAPADCCARKTRARDPSAPLPKDRKSALLRAVAERIRRGDALLYGEAPLESLPRKIAALPADAPVQQVFPLRFALGDALLSNGDVERPIQQSEECRKLAVAAHDEESVADVTRWIALAWLRLGERQNCITNHNSESCILPLTAAAQHVDRRGSERAIAELESAL